MRASWGAGARRQAVASALRAGSTSGSVANHGPVSLRPVPRRQVVTLRRGCLHPDSERRAVAHHHDVVERRAAAGVREAAGRAAETVASASTSAARHADRTESQAIDWNVRRPLPRGRSGARSRARVARILPHRTVLPLHDGAERLGAASGYSSSAMAPSHRGCGIRDQYDGRGICPAVTRRRTPAARGGSSGCRRVGAACSDVGTPRVQV